MKRVLQFVILGFLFCFPQVAFAEFFDIKNFEVDVQVEEESHINVKERIDVEFSAPRHGIFRDIPVEYKNDGGFAYNLRLNVEKVYDENIQPHTFVIESAGDSKRIRIGDADKYVNGNQTYIIEYGVDRGIRYFEDHDELYWNVTGNEWPVSIETTSAVIHFPMAASGKLDAVCYTGGYGVSDNACTIEVQDASVVVRADRPFSSYEGLTVAVAVPKGILYEPSLWEKIEMFLIDNYGFFIPIFALFLMIFLYLKYGRDPDLKKTIIAFYEPPDKLTPAEVGTIIDESADMKDISAEIIHLAVHGHLIIEELPEKGLLFKSRDYNFVKRTGKTKLNEYQQKIMNGIFGSKEDCKLSSLKNKFYKNIPEIQNLLYDSMMSRKYFPKSPQSVRNKYIIWGVLILIAFIFIGIFFERFDVLIGGGVSGVIVIAFSFFMPAKTRKGAEAHWQVLGFKEYIKTAERYRVEFQEKKHIFEEFLPYAMVYGLADKWSDAFKDIYKEAPDWYKSDYPQGFTTGYLLGSLNNLSSNMNSTLKSAPSNSSSSSGMSGGFSGGGFGGGGGGSW